VYVSLLALLIEVAPIFTYLTVYFGDSKNLFELTWGQVVRIVVRPAFTSGHLVYGIQM